LLIRPTWSACHPVIAYDDLAAGEQGPEHHASALSAWQKALRLDSALELVVYRSMALVVRMDFHCSSGKHRKVKSLSSASATARQRKRYLRWHALRLAATSLTVLP
jgi:hypothetical protein